MKIGLLVCAYNCADTIQECLQPWVNIEQDKRLDLDIAIVSTQFKGFEAKNNNPTIAKISEFAYKSKVCVIENPYPLDEHEARNMPLFYLLSEKCDVIWLLDGDEFYTEEQILKIAAMVEKQPLVTWWSIPFKNYLFDGKQYIEGFNPPRIFRAQVGKHVLKEFYWDNDVTYESINGQEKFDYKTLSHISVPKHIANIRHMTWLNKNGLDKVRYQIEHFGHCGYRWNEEKQELEFDKEFHKNNNIPLPTVFTD